MVMGCIDYLTRKGYTLAEIYLYDTLTMEASTIITTFASINAEWQLLGKAALLMTLIGAASAICTPKGKLPLALRGLKKILKQDAGVKNDTEPQPIPAWTKAIAFILVLAAAALAIA